MSSRKGLITAPELAARLDHAGGQLAVVDLRQKRDDGLGAIPGSTWVDLHDGFAQRRPGRQRTYDLPRPDELAASMSRLGIGPETEVVLADDMGNRWATRAYWVLRYYRHSGAVRVLDGGLAAWRNQGLPTETGFAARTPTSYPLPADPDRSILATAEEVRDGVAAGRVQACDSRTEAEYTGAVVQSGRGGHIPGAVHVEWSRALGPDGTFLANAELGQRLRPFISSDREPVTYCQGGVRASLTWFCLNELLGHAARLYAASWEEWGVRHDLPVDK